MKLKPIRDQVIVKVKEAEKISKGGIILVESAQEKPQIGEVVAVGNGRVDENGKTIPCEMTVGDSVIFGKYAGSEIKLDGETFLTMRESDIFCVVEN